MAINPRTLLNTAFTVGGTNMFADFRANETARSPKRYNKLTTIQNGGIPWDTTPCFSLITHTLTFKEDNSANAAVSKTQPVLGSSINFFRKTDMAFMGYGAYSMFNSTDGVTGIWNLTNSDPAQVASAQWITVANPQPMPTNVTTTPTTQSVSVQISNGPVTNPTPSARGSIILTVPGSLSYQEVVISGVSQVKLGLSFTVSGTTYSNIFFINSSSKLVKLVSSDGTTPKEYIRY